jgi:RimJ/RimL family protein N-acetyltransferase
MTSPPVSFPKRTKRLVLRKVRDEDIDRLLEFRNQPEVYQWLMRTVVDAESFRAAWMRTLTEPADHSTVVELDGVVIGTASLEVGDAMGQDGGGPSRGAEAHLGYIFDPAYAGQGYATEVATELLRISFEDLGVHRAYAGCFADNTASVRVLEKIGMRREQHGVQDSWHAELGWIDGATYAMLAEEWMTRR